MKTLYDEYMEDKEFARLMAQENLLMCLTEHIEIMKLGLPSTPLWPTGGGGK